MDTTESAYSYGTRAIIKRIESYTYSPLRPVWDLYLINAYTILRNVYQSKLSHTEIVSLYTNDLISLVSTINGYVEIFSGGRLTKPTLCIYFPHYEDIPLEYRKVKLGTDYGVYVHLRSYLQAATEAVSGHAYAVSLRLIDAVGPWPHTTLTADLTDINPIVSMNTLMISNAPIDFHIARFVQRFAVCESFTGHVKDFNQLGSKVISRKGIPFNRFTHLLFGDKLCIKPLLTKKQMSYVEEVATRDHWLLLPLISVIEAILDTQLVSKQILLTPQI